MQLLTRCSNPNCTRYVAVHPDHLGTLCRCPACRSEFRPCVPFGTTGIDGMVRYHLNELLGKGGVGLVFRAYDYMFQRDVALKVLAADSLPADQADHRFRTEAKALMALSHPNICPILDFNDEHWYPYIVMPVLEGGDLESWLERNSPAPVRRVCEMVRTVALAMEHAHRHRVIHRDLKLSNILLDSEGNPNVADFGFARLIDRSGSGPISNPGQVFGTVRYMPPEQLRGDRDQVVEPADIYALGIVLFRLLTRRFPFMSALAKGVKEEILHGITVSPSSLRPDLDARLDAIFLRAVARQVHKRFTSMEEFADELGRFLGYAPPVVTSVPPDLTQSTPSTVSVTSSPLGVLMAEIPRGYFRMGDDDGRPDEWPTRWVTIDRRFLLGIFPVTQSQYRELMGDAPRPEFHGLDNLPMECVTWLDAVKYCNVLSIKENLKPYYKIDVERVSRVGGNGYRLPTEAEWEYACRAGSVTRYSFGDDAKVLAQNAWFSENSQGQTHPVGEWPRNAFALHDMHGNVWEWCWDWYGDFDPRAAKDPKGPKTGSRRVLRGGSWGCDAFQLRSASRMSWEPNDVDFRPWYFGFRIARDF
jgi:eukaryotic-like serine/threonine-protein kinase